MKDWNEILDEFQDKIKTFREFVHCTQEEFAKKTGISRTTICHLESGKCRLTKVQYYAIKYVLANWGEIA